MTFVKARIRVAPDGTLSGHALGLPAGEHDAEIMVRQTDAPARESNANELLARLRTIQAALARLPVRDPRTPEEILGYNERGHFD